MGKNTSCWFADLKKIVGREHKSSMFEEEETPTPTGLEGIKPKEKKGDDEFATFRIYQMLPPK